MIAATLAIPLAATVALSGGQAVASSGPKGKLTCTTIRGSAIGTVTISGCSDTNMTGVTGSHPISATALAAGGTITWNNGKTTTFGKPTLSSKSDSKKCPGYVKHGPASSNSLDTFSGAVTQDTSGLKLPGKYKGSVCVEGNAITPGKALKVS